MFCLFIDDERNPIDVTWGSWQDQAKYRDLEWIIARDWPEVCELVLTFGMPELISFDHDLGDGRSTGYDIAKKLVDLVLDAPEKYVMFSDYMIHSKNPVGAENIKCYLEGFLKSTLT